jgi:hypothetical protein
VRAVVRPRDDEVPLRVHRDARMPLRAGRHRIDNEESAARVAIRAVEARADVIFI